MHSLVYKLLAEDFVQLQIIKMGIQKGNRFQEKDFYLVRCDPCFLLDPLCCQNTSATNLEQEEYVRPIPKYLDYWPKHYLSLVQMSLMALEALMAIHKQE